MRKMFKRENGISMIEVMVAISMMGAAAFYFMKMQQNQLRTQKTAMNSLTITQFINEFKGYLAKPGVCSASLKDMTLKSDLEIEKIKRSGGAVKYAAGDKLKGSSFQLQSMVLKDVYIDELEEGATTARGEGMLELTFTMYKNTAYGNKTRRKTFELDFQVDSSDKIIECAPLGHLSLPTVSTGGSDSSGDQLGTNDYEKAFDSSVQDAMKATGSTVDQTAINNTIKKNENLQDALKSIKNIQEINKKIEEALNE